VTTVEVECHESQLRHPHLQVPDERARLRARRRPLEADGHVLADSEHSADVVVVNICCIREGADTKTYDNLAT